MSRRLDSFCRFSLTTTGTWAQTGGLTPSASQSSCCLGVLGRCSSARITWVMPMVMSSTTLASRNTGEPSARAITKSSIFAFSNVGSPRTRSTTFVSPSSGVRNRSARPSPGPRLRSRQKPSYPEYEFPVRACTISRVQSQ